MKASVQLLLFSGSIQCPYPPDAWTTKLYQRRLLPQHYGDSRCYYPPMYLNHQHPGVHLTARCQLTTSLTPNACAPHHRAPSLTGRAAKDVSSSMGRVRNKTSIRTRSLLARRLMLSALENLLPTSRLFFRVWPPKLCLLPLVPVLPVIYFLARLP